MPKLMPALCVTPYLKEYGGWKQCVSISKSNLLLKPLLIDVLHSCLPVHHPGCDPFLILRFHFWLHRKPSTYCDVHTGWPRHLAWRHQFPGQSSPAECAGSNSPVVILYDVVANAAACRSSSTEWGSSGATAVTCAPSRCSSHSLPGSELRSLQRWRKLSISRM